MPTEHSSSTKLVDYLHSVSRKNVSKKIQLVVEMHPAQNRCNVLRSPRAKYAMVFSYLISSCREEKLRRCSWVWYILFWDAHDWYNIRGMLHPLWIVLQFPITGVAMYWVSYLLLNASGSGWSNDGHVHFELALGKMFSIVSGHCRLNCNVSSVETA